jgi:hypothetical protein
MVKRTYFHSLLLISVCCVMLFSQQQPKSEPLDPASPASVQSTIEAPLTQLTLTPGKPIPGLERSNVVARPIQCTGEGGVLMEIPLPPNYRDYRVASLTPSGGRFLDPSAIPGLYDLFLLSFFPSDSGVDLLYYGTEENKQSDSRMVTDEGRVINQKTSAGEHRNFLVRFGRDGQYKSMARLPSGRFYLKMAELASGELLLLSYDKTNRTPLLELTDSDGKPIRGLTLQGGLVDYGVLHQAEAGNDIDAAHAETSVAGWQFIPSRGRVLLYRPRARAPIMEIGNGGFTREVTLEITAGYDLDSFVPSTGGWFARFRRSSGTGEHDGMDSSAKNRNFLMAELNPADGSIRRLFAMEDGSFFNIACEVDGKFISYSTDLGSQFLLSYTDVPK